MNILKDLWVGIVHWGGEYSHKKYQGGILVQTPVLNVIL